MFAQGYNGVLKPYFDNGTYVKVGEPAGTWTPSIAATTFQQQYTAHKNINAVVTPNDDNANAVIAVLQSHQDPGEDVPDHGSGRVDLAACRTSSRATSAERCTSRSTCEAQAAGRSPLYLRAGEKVPSSLL